jgi:hypothetical protein
MNKLCERTIAKFKILTKKKTLKPNINNKITLQSIISCTFNPFSLLNMNTEILTNLILINAHLIMKMDFCRKKNCPHRCFESFNHTKGLLKHSGIV